MRFISSHGCGKPELIRLEKGMYVFDIGDSEYLSRDTEIFSKNFQINGNEIVPIDCDDGKILFLTAIESCFSLGDFNVVEAHHASLFAEPFLVEYFQAAGERGFFYLSHIYIALDDPTGYLVVNRKGKWFFGRWNYETTPIQVSRSQSHT